ncbi:2-oxoglutarate dehydrogenase E1 component [Francisella philomiragia]|uniref:2-oxoglutarate dehydrogenase E1 component n=1 Tax=Francisella philomiragia TaxID=28110 RepID=UPI001906688A|nr:2-oxoglutarate dehydrogenase E1 component [Francisella philomiragia]MBK2256797.1 2-oxoglutarate dehydrogenase E1 component [Francisella philomiragia]MBK2269455.1 2-oxoglutarate dehydrogenase E1 component [Francisella philomiragia]MBK2271180.1 2-oxoglutarate dehydrogenase E1 component [Francisella philomiragia]MBK2274960.1 2-oxoglutarate dehydrogenase E1 component [Francisella philomiragia]MBK2294554.1 2-oxoglutarate dehydrogenase E1 component [Francisella philomiragia]
MKKKQPDFSQWLETTQLFGGNLEYLESIYDDYIMGNYEDIDPKWLSFFDSIASSTDTVHRDLVDEFKFLAKNRSTATTVISSEGDVSLKAKALVKAYRSHGYKSANIDPLGLMKYQRDSDLELSAHGLSEKDLSEKVNLGEFTDNKAITLKEIIDKAKAIYESSVGYEYRYIGNKEEKLWLQDKIEKNLSTQQSDKKWILQQLVAAEGLEKYLALRYVGQKRFGLEGGESLIPSLQHVIEKAVSRHSTRFIQLGMAHRGRLNVLVNVMGKNPKDLFEEFEGKRSEKSLSGDVKYHMGYSNYRCIGGKEAKIALAFNPSHLETVDPVVEGAAKAIQDKLDGNVYNKVLPILIHGDSAFCGQGIVMETFGFSLTEAYGTGGTVHLVVNNQVGFTTSSTFGVNRSSNYSTDIAKMVDAPIFHVNCDDPEAVLKVADIALEYRMKFNKDVVIDLVCYRRNGHNETDEPSGTQPQMYEVIKKLPSTLKLYSEKLIREGVVDSNLVAQLNANYRSKLDNGQVTIDILDRKAVKDKLNVCDWLPYIGKQETKYTYHAISENKLKDLALKMSEVPEEVSAQMQVKKAITDRVKMANGELPLNWGFAESLAYATLLDEGYSVRLSGEDSGRGTFSHRHAVVKNMDTSSQLKEYVPLQHINEKARFDVIDSTLSEYGVLGFEYGYSCYSPDSLVIWEAQFGDFVNTAQVVIDQFLVAAEEKWGILSGLTLFLPHGQEGAGAEHSSARLERFLQSCANKNMQVCTPTTPAQIYHLLRRQVIRPLRKPLIVMTPKSLLRNPMAVSTLEELSKGKFESIIDDASANKEKVKKLILCNGKVYYDLIAKKQDTHEDIAVVRLEELYPFPQDELADIFAKYKHADKVVWLQEEPQNKGAWYNIRHFIEKLVLKNQELLCVARERSSTPAVGYHVLYVKQQEEIINRALEI